MEPARKGIRWRFLEEVPPGDLLEAAAQAPGGTLILKSSPFRLVCRLRGEGAGAVVKIHLARGPLRRGTARLGLDPASREARTLRAARKAGLPAPRPLALGRTPSGETRLLMEDLGPGATLADLLEEGDPGRKRILAAARLTAKLHLAGFRHADLHPGNLFFPRRGEEPFLLDLQAARPGLGPLGRRGREKALAFLWLSGRRSLPARRGLLFLRAYLQVFPWPRPESPASLGERLERAAALLERKTWIRREDRPFRNCSEFLELPGLEGPAFQARSPGAPSPGEVEDLLERKELQYLRRGRRGFVARGGGWILKERDLSHAKALWLAHYRLLQRQIPAPRALLLLTRRRRGLVVVQDLGELPDLGRALAQAGEESRRQALLEAAARLAAALHAGGLRNRDLKAANLLVQETPRGPLVLPVDLDGLDRPRRLGRRHVARDLARLSASLLSREIPWRPFLEAYRRALPEGNPYLPPLEALEEDLEKHLARLGPRP